MVGFRRQIVAKLQENGRALRPESMARQLEMYLDVINHESFDPDEAVRVFEDEQLGDLCTGFQSETRAFLAEAQPIDVSDLAQYLAARRQHVLESGIARREEYRLSENWPQRLEHCVWEVERRAAVQHWQAAARLTQETATRCFFLDEIATLERTYTESFMEAFLPSAEERECVFAAQRVQLTECVTLGNVLRPFVSWLFWPVFSLYRSLIGDLRHLPLHGVSVCVLYVFLQMQHLLPPYLDLSFKLLREMPSFMDFSSEHAAS